MLNTCLYIALAISTKQLVGTQYYTLYHGAVILIGNNGYRKHVQNILLFICSIIGQLLCIAYKIHCSLQMTAIAQCVSIGLSCIFIFQPYLPIQYHNNINIVRFGVSNDAEFHDSNFFEVTDSIDVKCGIFIQLGVYHKWYS